MTLLIVVLATLPFSLMLAYRAASLFALLPIGPNHRRLWRKGTLITAGITLLIAEPLFAYVVSGVLARVGVH